MNLRGRGLNQKPSQGKTDVYFLECYILNLISKKRRKSLNNLPCYQTIRLFRYNLGCCWELSFSTISLGQVVNFIWLEKQQTSLDHQYLERAALVQGSLEQACHLQWMAVPSLVMLVHLINKLQDLMSSAFPLVLHLLTQMQTDLLRLACFNWAMKSIRLPTYQFSDWFSALDNI